MQAVLYRIQGQVQGVGFRQFTCRAAQECDVKGWVRNLPDGSVECLAQASLESLTRFRAQLARGPERSRVVRLEEQTTRSPEPFTSFTIQT